MQSAESLRVDTQSETDEKMLAWLRQKLAERFSETGPSRAYSDAIISRFAELIENQSTFKRSLDSIQDAHKLAMAQMQFAQSVVRQLERQVKALEDSKRNGRALPNVELKGE